MAGQLGQAISEGDMNNLETGIYSTAGSMNTNLPADFGYGIIICFNAGKVLRKLQLAYSMLNKRLYVRGAEGEIWETDWHKLTQQ